MVEKTKTGEEDFISYLDDDNKIKNQWVIILKQENSGITFKFNNNEQQIFIPISRILKIKFKGNNNEY
ncbi:hypothetical protein GF374_01050 [Candidatus Woesearchaeota archaeon]|nr:hypothetical protein [Candidatus Woesearchaeota archaeon]